MEREKYCHFLDILKEELVPAMGCTEPIAVAYAAALAAAELPGRPQRVEICVSSNIIKNVKSVIVPNTDGMHGLEAAAAAGIVAGDPTNKLLVISQVTPEQKKDIEDYLKTAHFSVEESHTGEVFDICIRLTAGAHTSLCRIAGDHTNVVQVVRDGEVQQEKSLQKPEIEKQAAEMEICDIVAFADEVEISDVAPILDRQITCNMDIAQEGLTRNYGARIGQVLLACREPSVYTKAKAYAAAASDARMGGCEKPVVINSGSGNQGITASVPVIVYARELGLPQEKLYRALVVSNLTTIHLKQGIGPLSAYCGAISAGAAAGAGMMYLKGGSVSEIGNVVLCTIGNVGGVLCDGAKSSCAAKIASAVDAALLAIHLTEKQRTFGSGEGLVKDTLAETVAAISTVAREGMQVTDDVILDVMVNH